MTQILTVSVFIPADIIDLQLCYVVLVFIISIWTYVSEISYN